MGSLVLIRKVGESVRVYNAAKTRYHDIELMNIGKEGVIFNVKVSHTSEPVGNHNVKFLFNVSQPTSGGAIEVQRQSNKQIKMLFDLPRDINVVRKELIK